MAKPQIALQVLKRSRVPARPDLARLSRVAAATLRAEKVGGRAELGLLITDDREMRALNARYLGQKGTTDVLAFPGSFEHLLRLRHAPRYLGDIVISYPQAKRQAEEVGQGVRSELDLLLVHGILHLLGYTDKRPKDRLRMWRRQEEILSRVRRAKV